MKQLFLSKDIRQLSIFTTVIVLVIFTYISIEKNYPRRDERNFMIPTAVNFYEKPIIDAITGDTYTAGTTPLPFIILKLLTFNSYPNLFFYRLISLIFSLTSIILLINLLSKISPGKAAFFIPGLLLFHPYFFKSAFTFYTAAYGIFFMILFLRSYFKNAFSISGMLILGALSSAAILCNQVYIAIPVAFSISYLSDNWSKIDRSKIIKLFIFYLPHLFPLALFISWGGLTHDQPRNQVILASDTNIELIKNLIPFKNLTAIFTICGFYLIPASFYQIKKIKWQYLVVFLAISVLLSIFNQPVFSKFPDYNKVTGIVHRIIFSASIFNPYLGETLRIVCVLSFFIFIKKLWKPVRNILSDFILLLIIGFILIFFLDFFLSERHLIPLIAVLFITLHKIKISEFYFTGWFFIMMLAGCEYAVYWYNY